MSFFCCSLSTHCVCCNFTPLVFSNQLSVFTCVMPENSQLNPAVKIDPFDPHSAFERWVRQVNMTGVKPCFCRISNGLINNRKLEVFSSYCQSSSSSNTADQKRLLNVWNWKEQLITIRRHRANWGTTVQKTIVERRNFKSTRVTSQHLYIIWTKSKDYLFIKLFSPSDFSPLSSGRWMSLCQRRLGLTALCTQSFMFTGPVFHLWRTAEKSTTPLSSPPTSRPHTRRGKKETHRR